MVSKDVLASLGQGTQGIRVAKASLNDLAVAVQLAGALEALTQRWGGMVPDEIANNKEGEPFDEEDREQAQRVLAYLIDLAKRGSLDRVVFGYSVLVDPRNRFVDPDSEILEYHTDTMIGEVARTAQPRAQWTEEMGDAWWWAFPVDSAPWRGRPTDVGWPGHHTHWTPLVAAGAAAAGSSVAAVSAPELVRGDHG
jgi:hypothetical protein